MKSILLVTSIMVVLMLGGCTVSPSVLGDNNIVGIGGEGALEDENPPKVIPPNSETSAPMGPPEIVGMPNATGSIVPPRDELAVVDLPDSSARMQSSSSFQGREVQSSDGEDMSAFSGDQVSSANERHRRELINRGDLREGQLLPVE